MRPMHAVMILLGFLLVLFGGGCTVVAFMNLEGAPWSGAIIGIWLIAGLTPLVIGCLMIWAGFKRAKPLAELKPPEAEDKN